MQRVVLSVVATLGLLALPQVGRSEPEGPTVHEYWLEGNDRERGAFTGTLRVRDLGDGQVAVERHLRYADGREVTQTGRGAWAGRQVLATFPPAPGAAGALDDLLGARRPRRALRFQLALDPTSPEVARGVAGDALGVRDRATALLVANPGDDLGEESLPKLDDTSAEGYHLFVGVPFVRGEEDPLDIDANDVKQGSLGDCYLVGGLIAVARTRPEAIRAMIRDEGGGNYSVLLRNVRARNAERKYVGPARNLRVRMDTSFPYRTRDGAPAPAFAAFGDSETRDGVTRHELWPAMIEKAYAQNAGGYERMRAGRATTVYNFATGRPTRTYETKDTSAAELDRVLREAHARGWPVCFGVDKQTGPRGGEVGIIGYHTYALWQADEAGGYRWYNPWKTSHPNQPLTGADLKAIGGRVYVGEIP